MRRRRRAGNFPISSMAAKRPAIAILLSPILPATSRQKIGVTIQIDAPPAKVWATIADFHDLRWFPGVAKTTGEGGNEPGVAKRQLTLDGGATIDESLSKYDAGAMSYSYRIDKVM
jgi:Polyketide cyclase / dehydrase and lipid transport